MGWQYTIGMRMTKDDSGLLYVFFKMASFSFSSSVTKFSCSMTAHSTFQPGSNVVRYHLLAYPLLALEYCGLMDQTLVSGEE